MFWLLSALEFIEANDLQKKGLASESRCCLLSRAARNTWVCNWERPTSDFKPPCAFLPYWLPNSLPLLATSRTKGLTWFFLEKRSSCRGQQQQTATPVTQLSFTLHSLWQFLAAVQLGAGNGLIKAWKVSLLSETGQFYHFSSKLFQS